MLVSTLLLKRNHSLQMFSPSPLFFLSPGSYIFVLYVAEQPELPVGPLGVDEGLERTIQLLDGHLLLGLLVNGRTERKRTKCGILGPTLIVMLKSETIPISINRQVFL